MRLLVVGPCFVDSGMSSEFRRGPHGNDDRLRKNWLSALGAQTMPVNCYIFCIKYHSSMKEALPMWTKKSM